MYHTESSQKTRLQSPKRVSTLSLLIGFSVALLFPFGSNAALPPPPDVKINTHHFNNYRTGHTKQETILNTTNVNVNTFGKKFSINLSNLLGIPVTQQNKILESQILFVPSVTFPGKGTHNAIYLCTVYNTCYAFDADSSQPPLWQSSVGSPLQTGNQGVRSTPVIDTTSNTIYIVARTYDSVNQHFVLHALDLTTGQERSNSPVEIQGSVFGIGTGSKNGILRFDPSMHSQRPALLLQNGNVYIAFGSFVDISPSHGWVFSYNASTLQFNSVVSTSPNTDTSGIWQDGAGIAADDKGFIYVQTANRVVQWAPQGNVTDFSNSLLKISTANNTLNIVDYFTPSNQSDLNDNDADMSSSGPLVIPGTNIGTGGGKDGVLYVWNTNNLGQFNSVVDQVLEYWQLTTNQLFATPAQGDADLGIWAGNVFFDGTDPANGIANGVLYNWGMYDVLKSINFKNQRFDQVNISTGKITNTSQQRLSISSNGIQPGTAILWTHGYLNGWQTTASGLGGIVRAFDASNISTVLWDSSQNSARDNVCPSTLSFWWQTGISPPVVANGKVYVASPFCGVITVYGLL